MTPGELLLDDIAHWKVTHTIWIKNAGKTRTYTLKHVPAGTAVTLEKDRVQPALGPVPQDNTIQAQVHLSLQRVTLLPGISLPIIVSIQPPKNVDAKALPVLSGQIVISTAGETLRVSYLGVAGALKSASVIDNTDEILGVPTPLILDGVGGIQVDPTNYTFVGEDYPVIAWRQVFGSPSIKLDLVDADIELKTTLTKRGPVLDWLSSWWWPGIFKPIGGSFAKVPTLGPLFQYDWMPRNDLFDSPYFETAIGNAFANGTAIPYGQYRALFRALKVSGDARKEEDYEVWLSPVIGIVPPA